MDPNKTLNMTMLCDFYELTMGNGYLDHNMQDSITYFDVFFRSVPDDGGYAIAAGLEQIIDYIQNLHFTDEDIAYLRGRKLFSEAFLDYLKNFRFTGDIWAVPEGTPVFPREPLITVRAPAIQAQLVETYLLLQINHQSLIATKARAPPTSAAVPEPPARSRTSCSAYSPAARWRTPGCRCSTPSSTPSAPTARPTPPTPPCSWTPTTACSPACRTPSAPSTRCSSRWASRAAASASTPATSPT